MTNKPISANSAAKVIHWIFKEVQKPNTGEVGMRSLGNNLATLLATSTQYEYNMLGTGDDRISRIFSVILREYHTKPISPNGRSASLRSWFLHVGQFEGLELDEIF